MSVLPIALALTLSSQFPAQAHNFLDLSQGQTHYQDIGEGPVVVLIHGVSGPLQVWDKTVPVLDNAGHRVIRFDLYGRGMSARLHNSPYDLNVYMRQLGDLLKALQVKSRIHFVGSSFGAVIASEYAIRHPDRAASVTLVGPAGTPIKTPLSARLGNVPVLGDAVKPFVSKSIIKKQNRRYAYDASLFLNFWPYFDAQLSVDGTVEAMLRTMEHAPVTNYVNQYAILGNLAVPVSVIWGTKDVTFPYANHRLILNAIPNANFTTIKDAGHLPQWEQPEFTNDAILQSLRAADDTTQQRGFTTELQ